MECGTLPWARPSVQAAAAGQQPGLPALSFKLCARWLAFLLCCPVDSACLFPTPAEFLEFEFRPDGKVRPGSV